MGNTMEFTDQYLVGIEQVDREHRQLFAIVADIQQALAGDGALAGAQKAVRELLDYTQTHFASEEGLMAAAGFPELAAHRQLHADLLGQVHDMEMRIELEGEMAALELSRFLVNWLIEHIQQSDRRFGVFVAAGQP